jgi:hypothetical protein
MDNNNPSLLLANNYKVGVNRQFVSKGREMSINDQSLNLDNETWNLGNNSHR